VRQRHGQTRGATRVRGLRVGRTTDDAPPSVGTEVAVVTCADECGGTDVAVVCVRKFEAKRGEQRQGRGGSVSFSSQPDLTTVACRENGKGGRDVRITDRTLSVALLAQSTDG
jgi:hypothetical protein